MEHRVIRFRAWDLRYQRWVPAGDFCISLKGQLLGSYTVDRRAEEFVIQQFTGLYDLDGTPIFEGDIVSFIDDGGDEGTLEIIAKVMWDDKGGWVYEGSFGAGDWLHHMDTDELTVIGDIYRNPELLNEKKEAAQAAEPYV